MIVFVATQGRATRPDGCCDQWVVAYTVEISNDCSTFSYIQNEAAQPVVRIYQYYRPNYFKIMLHKLPYGLITIKETHIMHG